MKGAERRAAPGRGRTGLRPGMGGLASTLLFVVAACSPVAAPVGPGPEGVRRERPAPERTARARRSTSGLPTALYRFEEVRGVWVVRTTLTRSERIHRMVQEAYDAGFNTLIVQVRGRGDAYYRSRWEPRAENIAEGEEFDPLALVIEEAHRRGMAVHAWVNTHLVWSGPDLPDDPEHLVRAHPDWLAVPRALGRHLYAVDPFDPSYVEALRRYASENASTVEGIYSSPSHPAVKDRIYDIWMDLAERYELDGIHFDYIRFPSAAFDYSLGALERFRRWVRERLSPGRFQALDRAYEGDPYAFVDSLAGPWGEFRRRQITELVERVYHGVKARRPDMVVSAAVFASAQDAYAHRFQDWRGWLEQGILDVAVPMAYTPENARFEAQVREATVSAGQRERVWAGIGAYLNTVNGTLDKIRIARREGAGGVILFSYDWAATEGSPEGSPPYLDQVGRAAFRGR